MMNGGEIKKVALNKAKQVAAAANVAANGNGGKKRRKGSDLKPIITTEGPQSADASPLTATNAYRCVASARFLLTRVAKQLTSSERTTDRVPNRPPKRLQIIFFILLGG
jgi:hypothetical protein